VGSIILNLWSIIFVGIVQIIKYDCRKFVYLRGGIWMDMDMDISEYFIKIGRVIYHSVYNYLSLDDCLVYYNSIWFLG